MRAQTQVFRTCLACISSESTKFQLDLITVAHVLRENVLGKWNWMASGRA